MQPAGATSGNPSNNTSVCTYAKRVGSGGRVYVEMAVTPVSLEPTACSAFNGGFGGRRIPTVGRIGTGHVYCRYNKIGSSYTIKLGAFASSRKTGLAFCCSQAGQTRWTASVNCRLAVMDDETPLPRTGPVEHGNPRGSNNSVP